MDMDTPDKKNIDRLRKLQEKRREIMALSAEEALDRILDDPQPAALVHSLPMTDFYLLLHDIGPDDSLPLLQLASDRQWDHIVDLETWRHDRFDLSAASRWFDLLLAADPDRFVRWTFDQRLDLIELYLQRNIQVRTREHDQDPSEFGKDFFSLDDSHYVRILDLPPSSEETVFNEEHRNRFINKFLHHLADFSLKAYQGLLLESAHLIPSETEEAALHWRNVRLAEKGFLPFDEAVGIYQPMSPDALPANGAAQSSSADYPDVRMPVPAYPFKELASDTPFGMALQQIDSGERLHRIQHEFVNLCNRIIVADHRTVRDQDGLREVVRKACGYLSIGLERLATDGVAVDPQWAAGQISRHSLGDLFRVGFGRALSLKWRAEKWLNTCWFAAADLRLTFWGEQWMGILGGLLVKKPLFYDNYRSGRLYREFESIEEIEQTDQIFEQIKAMDELLSLISVNLSHPSSYGLLTYKNLLLTLWVRHQMGLTAQILTPLDVDAFKSFFSDLFPDGAKSGAKQTGRIPESMKQNFLNWLCGQTGLTHFEINAQLGDSFVALFAEIEAELGQVIVERIDPRYINLFLLEQPGNNS